MSKKKYMVMLVDRKRAILFTIINGLVERKKEVVDGQVPQNVKHGDDTWDAEDKIFRHIQDHLHRHLSIIAEEAVAFVGNDTIEGILIGSHKELFSNIIKHIPYPLSRKIKGTFVAEFKVPFGEIIERAEQHIHEVERTPTK